PNHKCAAIPFLPNSRGYMKARYQKQPINATLESVDQVVACVRRQPRPQPHTATGWRPYGWLIIPLFLLALMQPRVAHAAPRVQTNPGTSPQLYLLPQGANNNVEVTSHIAILRVIDDANGPQLGV